MILEHPKYGKFEIIDLKQRHVEDFAEALGDQSEIKVMAYRRMVIESAIKAGWFVTPPEGDIRDQSPRFVAWLGDALGNLFASVIEIPPS